MESTKEEEVKEEQKTQKTKALNKFYDHVSTLGQGAFGTAHLVKHKEQGFLAVIKQMDISAMDDEDRKLCFKEAKILQVLDHQNITKFHEVYKTKKGSLHIVMEYADDGDLHNKIQVKQKNGQSFSEDEVLNIFTQISLALKHAHDRKILHRDLKAANIFLSKGGTVKLGDFGVAAVIEHTISKKDT